MKTNREIAHEYFLDTMRFIRQHDIPHDFDEVIQESWEYADKMQAEEDKRKVGGVPDALLTKDENGNCLHFHHEFGHKKCMDCGASLDDAQSQLDKMMHDDELMLREQARIKGINLDDYSFVKPYIPK